MHKITERHEAPIEQQVADESETAGTSSPCGTAKKFLTKRFGNALAVTKKHGNTWYAEVNINECRKSTVSETDALEKLARLFEWKEGQ